MMLSRYHVATPPVLDQQDGIAKRVVFATRTAQWRAIDALSWERIEQGDFTAISPPVLNDLRAIELVVPDGEDELATMLGRNRSAIDNDDELHLTIEPSALCQMGCGYCGQQHENQELSAENQDRLIERIRELTQSRKRCALHVAWFGAEPLLGLGVIRSLTPRFKALAAEHCCAYSASITTNGLALSSAVARELVADLGVRKFLIDLDGPADVHDARRPTKDGRGTFDRIFANVTSLAKRDDVHADIAIRCTVDRRNVDAVSPLIRLLAEAGVLERLLDFFAVGVYDWGNDAGSLALPKEEFAQHEARWLAELAALGFVSPRLIPKREAIRCLAVRRDSFLVDPYGQLFNCIEASLVPAPPPRPVPAPAEAVGANTLPQLPLLSTVATYTLGDLTSGEQPQRREILSTFNERVGRGEFSCPTCRMLPVCGGGCPKHWLEGNVPCPSAKFNIESRLLLGYALARLNGATTSPSPAPAS